MTLRAGARDASAAQWSKQTLLTERVGRGVAALDAHRAGVAAGSLARQWHAHRDEALADGADPAAAVRDAAKALKPAIDRTAETETVHAFNDEIARLNDRAYADGVEVVEVWNAMLDDRTCPVCDDLDGQERARPDVFVDRPPIHPRCRCILDTTTRAVRAA